MPKKKSHLWKTRRAHEIVGILESAEKPLGLGEILHELEEMGRRISPDNARSILKKLIADNPCVQRIGGNSEPNTTWSFTANIG